MNLIKKFVDKKRIIKKNEDIRMWLLTLFDEVDMFYKYVHIKKEGKYIPIIKIKTKLAYFELKTDEGMNEYLKRYCIRLVNELQKCYESHIEFSFLAKYNYLGENDIIFFYNT